MSFQSLMLISLALLPSFLNTSLGSENARPSMVVVIGAGGLPEYETQFRLWADRWESLAEHANAELILIGKQETSDRSDRDILQATIKAQSEPANSPLILVFLGHGTHGQGVAKFNLRGPDISATELANWVADCPRQLALIQCSSSSAAFLKELSGNNRTIITATRSSAEQNFSRFGDYFSTSLTDPIADLDHDNAISLLESFLFASNRVARFYDQESRLATEHSLLDDNGDGLGTPRSFFRGIRAEKSARDGYELDGLRAHQIILYRLPEHTTLPAGAVAERDELERKIESLRQQKGDLNEDQYYRKLEDLLVALSQLYAVNDN